MGIWCIHQVFIFIAFLGISSYNSVLSMHICAKASSIISFYISSMDDMGYDNFSLFPWDLSCEWLQRIFVQCFRMSYTHVVQFWWRNETRWRHLTQRSLDLWNGKRTQFCRHHHPFEDPIIRLLILSPLHDQ